MPSFTITSIVDEKRRIMIDLPDDFPIRLVKLTIEDIDSLELGSHEWIQAKLRAAGLLAKNVLTDEELAMTEQLSEDDEQSWLDALLVDDHFRNS